MSSRLLVALLVLCSLSSLAPAQMPPPAPELEKFAPLLGHWTMEGTAKFGPDMPEMPWTAVSTLSKILGGHFIQEDLKLDIGMGIPMVFRTIYAWDAESQRFRAYGFGNSGEVHFTDSYWHGKQLVGSSQTLENGVPVCDRWVTTPEGDTQHFEVERAIGGGSFFAMIEGHGKRADEGFSAGPEAEVPPMAPVGEAMKKLSVQLGRFTMKGEMSPMSGMPAMPVGGKQQIRPILGGHVHLTEIEGDPMPGSDLRYQGQLYVGWDARRSCLRALDLGSFGERIEYDVRWDGDKLVFAGMATVYGQPQLIRTVVTPLEEGAKIHLVSHRAIGAKEPEQSFEAMITRVKDGAL